MRSEDFDMEQATKIVSDFEGLFGPLTATERDWLSRRIAPVTDAAQVDRYIALLNAEIADNGRLRDALHLIAFYDGFMDADAAKGMMEIARRALNIQQPTGKCNG